MAIGSIREARDERLKTWERELERLRVALARAPEELHEQYSPEFTALSRVKEIVKSRWEAIRGVYQPAPVEIEGVQAGFEAMEKAWAAAQTMIASVLDREAISRPGSSLLRTP